MEIWQKSKLHYRTMLIKPEPITSVMLLTERLNICKSEIANGKTLSLMPTQESIKRPFLVLFNSARKSPQKHIKNSSKTHPKIKVSKLACYLAFLELNLPSYRMEAAKRQKSSNGGGNGNAAMAADLIEN